MIPKECKRLAEVDFPIAEVSRHAAREKSIRHGHPSTLHLWWARRPLASCRAMLLALLLPDPCDPFCPDEFKQKARELLPRVGGAVGSSDEDLRKKLLKFIADFSNWDVAADPAFLEVGRGLVRAAHPDETPLVVDPFAGGGSIPLEALRLGCDAFASDLNPVACLILKVLLEDIPRHGPALADELRRAGAEIGAAAERELGEFYPTDPDGSRPIAYLWARTVHCESPKCGAEIPLVRSFWLSKKANRRRALRFKVARSKDDARRVEFEVFEPATESDVQPGTVRLAKATCPVCGTVLAPERVRAQLVAQRGGGDVQFDERGGRTGGARLLAVVTLNDKEQERHYRLPTEQDYWTVWKAMVRLREVAAEGLPGGLSAVPDEPTPQDGTGSVGGGYRTRKYGIVSFGDFFSARQKLSLSILIKLVRIHADRVGVVRLLALALGKLIRHYNSVAKWHRASETVAGAFGLQAIPMSWDFPETFPFVRFAGGYDDSLNNTISVVEGLGTWLDKPGEVQLVDARRSPLPSDAGAVWFTDPPYYDAVPYADLSDFFFVWLKRALSTGQLLNDHSDPSNSLSPKADEIVRDEQIHLDGRPKKTAGWFQAAMETAFSAGRGVLDVNGIGSVVFAHKTTEGWEALLSGMINRGWVITGSWPVATERGARLRARESAALATSVHLVCRPRPEGADVGDWVQVLRELPARVRDWMDRLQDEGVRGADLVFACIGPALEIYSRYSRVETPEGRAVELPEYLERVWEVVGRTALEQILGTAEARARNGVAAALEEDARLTALFLWTLQTSNHAEADGDDEEDESEDDDEEDGRAKRGGYNLPFDVARRFAQPLGIDLPEWEGRVIEMKKGVVRLLSVRERSRVLFGAAGAGVAADRIERAPRGSIQTQLLLDAQPGAAPEIAPRRRGRKRVEASDEDLQPGRGATTLDRVHAAMLLQASGRANALRALLREEADRGPDFLRLANALSALYPKESEEKRLLDAMLLAMPR